MSIHEIHNGNKSKVRSIIDKVVYNKYVRTGWNWNTCIGVEIFNRTMVHDGIVDINSVVLLTVSGNQNADSQVVVELNDVDVESLRSIAQMLSDAADAYAKQLPLEGK